MKGIKLLECADGKYILFGSYPQSKVADNALCETLWQKISAKLPTVSNDNGWTNTISAGKLSIMHDGQMWSMAAGSIAEYTLQNIAYVVRVTHISAVDMTQNGKTVTDISSTMFIGSPAFHESCKAYYITYRGGVNYWGEVWFVGFGVVPALNIQIEQLKGTDIFTAR